MTWVLLQGYDDGYSGDGRLIGVFDTAEDAKAALPQYDWVQEPSGEWFDRNDNARILRRESGAF